MQCPTVGISAINRTNNTLVRENLYQDNTNTNQFFSQQILFCIDACLFPCLYHMRRSQGVGVKTQLASIFQRIGFEMFNFVGATFRLMVDNGFVPQGIFANLFYYKRKFQAASFKIVLHSVYLGVSPRQPVTYVTIGY